MKLLVSSLLFLIGISSISGSWFTGPKTIASNGKYSLFVDREPNSNSSLVVYLHDKDNRIVDCTTLGVGKSVVNFDIGNKIGSEFSLVTLEKKGDVYIRSINEITREIVRNTKDSDSDNSENKEFYLEYQKRVSFNNHSCSLHIHAPEGKANLTAEIKAVVSYKHNGKVLRNLTFIRKLIAGDNDVPLYFKRDFKLARIMNDVVTNFTVDIKENIIPVYSESASVIVQVKGSYDIEIWTENERFEPRVPFSINANIKSFDGKFVSEQHIPFTIEVQYDKNTKITYDRKLEGGKTQVVLEPPENSATIEINYIYSDTSLTKTYIKSSDDFHVAKISRNENEVELMVQSDSGAENLLVLTLDKNGTLKEEFNATPIDQKSLKFRLPIDENLKTLFINKNLETLLVYNFETNRVSKDQNFINFVPNIEIKCRSVDEELFEGRCKAGDPIRTEPNYGDLKLDVSIPETAILEGESIYAYVEIKRNKTCQGDEDIHLNYKIDGKPTPFIIPFLPNSSKTTKEVPINFPHPKSTTVEFSVEGSDANTTKHIMVERHGLEWLTNDQRNSKKQANSPDPFESLVENYKSYCSQPSRGNGEQKLKNFGILLAVAQRLNNVSSEYADVVECLKSQYNNITSSFEQDGSLKLWQSDASGNLWLTAYTAQLLSVYNQVTNSSYGSFERALEYINSTQKEDGRFEDEEGMLFRLSMGSAKFRKYYLTAFCILPFLKAEDSLKSEYQDVIDKGLSFLKNDMKELISDFEKAIAAYVFALNGDNSTANNFLTKHKYNFANESYIQQSLFIEVASYTAQTLIAIDNTTDMRAIDYLLDNRMLNGEFFASHDTVVGLQAIVDWEKKVRKREHANYKILKPEVIDKKSNNVINLIVNSKPAAKSESATININVSAAKNTSEAIFEVKLPSGYVYKNHTREDFVKNFIKSENLNKLTFFVNNIDESGYEFDIEAGMREKVTNRKESYVHVYDAYMPLYYATEFYDIKDGN